MRYYRVNNFCFCIIALESFTADDFLVNDEWNRYLKSLAIKGVFVLCKQSSRSCVKNDAARTRSEYLFPVA